MAWTKPEYSKGQVDSAGDWLINDDFLSWLTGDNDKMFAIINNWRSAHSYPLLAMRMTLTGRAKRVDERAIVAQRLKRLTSIDVKLRRNANMALSQMQDIGGCRAVVKTVGHVDRVVKLYDDAIAKNPKVRAQFVRKYDYIATPKDDGYRGVHLIYKYRSEAHQKQPWNGLRVEIQIRSRLQHAWATAVETVDIFTAQSIKTGGGRDEWRRFFVLMGSVMAGMERRPACPNTPADPRDLRRELRQAAHDLDVRKVLRGWTSALNVLPTQTAQDAGVYLLYVDAKEDTVKITGFDDADQAKASEVYLNTEKMIKDKPWAQAVLVSAGSVQALRSAFPNYFADTRVFLDALGRA
jgi:hypothetical protein